MHTLILIGMGKNYNSSGEAYTIFPFYKVGDKTDFRMRNTIIQNSTQKFSPNINYTYTKLKLLIIKWILRYTCLPSAFLTCSRNWTTMQKYQITLSNP
jgi:hypothetical protein